MQKSMSISIKLTDWIAHTQQEIDAIIRTNVFCVDKTCFLRPGYIIISSYTAHLYIHIMYAVHLYSALHGNCYHQNSLLCKQHVKSINKRLSC